MDTPIETYAIRLMAYSATRVVCSISSSSFCVFVKALSNDLNA